MNRWGRTGAVGLAAAILLLTGCRITGEKEILREAEQKTNVSISWWGNDERHQYMMKGISLFEEKHPQVDVSESYGVWDGFERRNRIAMKSNTAADVMLVNYSWLHTYSPDGTGYYDLNELSDVIDLSQFTEEDLELGTVNGHLNALPTAYNMSLMYFNKTLYDQYGVAVPETWDDLFEAAKAMNKDGIYPIGTVRKHLFLMLQAYYEQTTGEQLFNEDGKFIGTFRGIEQMLNFYKELLDQHVLMPIEQYDSNSFAAGKVAGIACWISDATKYSDLLTEKGENVVRGELLGTDAPDTAGWYIKPATMYAVSTFTQNPELSGALVDFLLNDTEMAVLQGTEKGVPVSRTARETLEQNGMLNSMESSSTQYLNENKEQLKTIVPIMENNDIIYGFKTISDEYLYGKCSLASCAWQIISMFHANGA